jgi:hypothetical protein
MSIVITPEFDRARMQAVARQKKLSVDTVRQLLQQLEAARDEVVLRISRSKPGSFTAAQLVNTRQEIDRVMDEFANGASRDVNQAQAQSFENGQQMVDQAMTTANVSPLMGRLDTTALEAAQTHVLPELRGISRDAALKIERALRRAQLGGQSMTDIVGQVGSAITGGEKPSFFSDAGQRAARITFHELHEIAGKATQSRLQMFADRLKEIAPGAGIPGGPGGTAKTVVGKEWNHTPQEHPRLGHVALDGSTRPVNERFTNPDTGEELMFPHDPSASISETINCKCFVLPALLAA